MKKLVSLFTIILATKFCIAQPIHQINIAPTVQDNDFRMPVTTDTVVHIDSTNGYSVAVPDWWNILETPPNFFGGIFPAVDSIENALIFKSFKKSKFKGLVDFENWVVNDYSTGQTPAWSNDHTMLLKKRLKDFQELGNTYKVQLIRGGKIYDCCYIITETNNAYIWIDFTATSTTYPKNFDKFKEIISTYKKL